MLKRILSINLFLWTCSGLFAQQGLFLSNGSEALWVAEGTRIKVQFSGYKSQPQEYTGQLVVVDSATLGFVSGWGKKKDTFSVALNDILGIRIYTNGRQLLKTATELVLFSGNLVLYAAVLTPSPLSPMARYALSLAGAGISYATVKFLFPDKINRKKSDGWAFKVENKPS